MSQQQWGNCLTCGGVIIPPNTAVQYSGPICNCTEQPRIRRRADAPFVQGFDQACPTCHGTGRAHLPGGAASGAV